MFSLAVILRDVSRDEALYVGLVGQEDVGDVRREGEPVERGYPAAELEDGGGRGEDPRGEERVGRGGDEGCEDGVDLPED